MMLRNCICYWYLNNEITNEQRIPTILFRFRLYTDILFQVMGDPFRAGQLMSIHGFIQRDGAEKQVPLAFVLMS